MCIQLGRAQNIIPAATQRGRGTVECNEFDLPGPVGNDPPGVVVSGKRTADEFHIIEPEQGFGIAVPERCQFGQIGEESI